MTLSWVTILCFLILVPTHAYNVMAICEVVCTYLNNRWIETKSGMYGVLIVLYVILSIVIGISAYIFFIIGLKNYETVQVVLTSFSVLLSFYVSYYQRFGKITWLIRYIY